MLCAISRNDHFDNILTIIYTQFKHENARVGWLGAVDTDVRFSREDLDTGQFLVIRRGWWVGAVFTYLVRARHLFFVVPKPRCWSAPTSTDQH